MEETKNDVVNDKKGKAPSVEDQKTRKLEYKNFDLVKMKMEKKGVNVNHYEGGGDPGLITKEGTTIAHPDLQKTLDKLKPIMARRLGLLEGTDLARELTQGDLMKYEKALQLEKEIIARCNVSGITFVGSGDKAGVMITGNVLSPNGGSTGLAVPKITFGQDVLGYEDETEELCEKVKKETFAYRFQNKKQQLDIEFEAEKIQAESEENEEKPKPKRTRTQKPAELI